MWYQEKINKKRFLPNWILYNLREMRDAALAASSGSGEWVGSR
jgi:hypothetical protein